MPCEADYGRHALGASRRGVVSNCLGGLNGVFTIWRRPNDDGFGGNVVFHRRLKMEMKLFRLGTSFGAGSSSGIVGVGTPRKGEDLVMDLSFRCLDFLWFIDVWRDTSSVNFSLTATPESRGPEAGGVTRPPTARDALLDKVKLLFALVTPDFLELLVSARERPEASPSCWRSSRSISPRTVLPFTARLSSGMGTNLTTPRSA